MVEGAESKVFPQDLLRPMGLEAESETRPKQVICSEWG